MADQMLDPSVTNTLGSYLESHIEGFHALQSIEKFDGGQSNPTFLLQTQGGPYVLRRKPPGDLLKSAHAVDREFRVLGALASTDVPVPRVYHLCSDDTVIGSMFYVMDYIDGRILWDQTLPGEDNDHRASIYDEMNRVLAAIHSVDLAAVGLSDFGHAGNYFERQIARWSKQYRASETEHIQAMETLMDWLGLNLPEDDGRISLVHGDYRLDNLILAHDQPKILAVVDWELSTIGHPFADLAYQCMQWYMPNDAFSRGLGDIDRSAFGIPTEQDYVSRYCERMGLAGIPNWNFYLGFSFFRIAAIIQGVMKRAIDGNASSPEALKMGRMTRPLAETALAIVDVEP